MRIEKAGEIGFCFGVKRAINILEKVACERAGGQTLGAVVHTQAVLQRQAEMGIRVGRMWMIYRVARWRLALMG